MSNQILNRILKIAGFLALFASLATPAAEAATTKRAVVKKPHLSRAVATKKVASTRKSMTFVSGSKRRVIVRAVVPAKPSFGEIAGLHAAQDPLDLKSSVALVIDQDTREVLFRKNDHAVLPIASLTKLMTGVIVSGAKLPMDEVITVTQDDVDTEKGSRSRLKVGTSLTRGELLHLALMSSENRAAHALGRTYPGVCRCLSV